MVSPCRFTNTFVKIARHTSRRLCSTSSRRLPARSARASATRSNFRCSARGMAPRTAHPQTLPAASRAGAAVAAAAVPPATESIATPAADLPAVLTSYSRRLTKLHLVPSIHYLSTILRWVHADQPFFTASVCHRGRCSPRHSGTRGDVCRQPQHWTWTRCRPRFRPGHCDRNVVPCGGGGSRDFRVAGFFRGGVSVRKVSRRGLPDLSGNQDP